MNSSAAKMKMVWLVILFSMVVSVCMYGVIGFILTQQGQHHPPTTSLETMRFVCYGGGIFFVVAAVGWSFLKLNVPQPPPQFQTNSIIAMALAEACAVMGLLFFFVGAPLTQFVPFALGAIAVDILCILPAGLRYWSGV